jgi:hypothetical protein
MREITSHLLKQTSELYSLSNNCGLRFNVLTCVLLAYYATKSGRNLLVFLTHLILSSSMPKSDRNLLVFLTQLILSSSKPKMEAADSFETLVTTSKTVHCTTEDKCYMPIYVYECTTQVLLEKKITEQNHLPYTLQNF